MMSFQMAKYVEVYDDMLLNQWHRSPMPNAVSCEVTSSSCYEDQSAPVGNLFGTTTFDRPSVDSMFNALSFYISQININTI